ncbi:RagB/SusD family nutrient uptake outer membrane protein [Palleniella muris]|uniref:RagB/SusD family nutrient uptake outer membrane protein n=1 Tax=Palleniella muris TaxID=3038145 RepID=A0AC61QQE5_9BACT|nr:RagB/SusD family nutrient uptake outer membrane protein [Palleniella muris]TGX82180.1 RagB/SusD family nutrient uptake outer membrane protein [Palleniella muris]
MNIKFIKNILPVSAIALTMGLASCDYLDVEPQDPSSISTVDEAGLYTKCYANMALAGNTGANGDCDIDGLDGGTTGFVRQLWNANELPTDEAICAWGDTGIPQFNYNQWDASHPMLQGFYYRLYAGIDYCNHYLEVCAGVDATREAEVRFLRALYYYYLMDCFGNVPFATQISAESPEQIQRADLFNWIEGELLAVKDQMQTPVARKSSDTGYGRADQDAANLLLARMYLNAEVYTGTARWADAQTYAEKVINGPHKLWTGSVNGWSSYQMLFMGDNGENGASQEAILPLLQDGKTTTSWGASLFLMASTWKADMDIDGNFNTTEFWAGNRARSQFVAKFFPNGDAPQTDLNSMPIAAGDDRALFFGKDRELVVTTPSEYTSGYAVGKFRNTYSTGGAGHSSQFIDTDYFLMRSAEAYLIAAEADARLNGGTTTATGTKYMDDIRNRAHASTSLTYSLNQIIDERARELYYEGFRRTDLIRFDMFHSNKYMWEWKGGAQNGASFAAYRDIYAIPAEDMNANPKLTQNNGY